MRAVIVCSVLCVTLGVLDAVPFDTLAAAATPKPCCVPDQLEFRMGESIPYFSGGKAGLTSLTAWIAVDYKAKKMAGNETVYSDGRTMNISAVADFNSMVMYMVDWDKGKCTKTKLPSQEMAGQCLPDDAQYVGTVTFGLGQTLRANEWQMHIKDEEARMDVNVFVIMTSDTCVPVAESVVGRTSGAEIAAGMSYFDFKDKITDPSVFDVPAICKKDDVPELQSYQGSTFQNYLVHKQHAVKMRKWGPNQRSACPAESLSLWVGMAGVVTEWLSLLYQISDPSEWNH